LPAAGSALFAPQSTSSNAKPNCATVHVFGGVIVLQGLLALAWITPRKLPAVAHNPSS
jgi:hypothetical protein